MSSNNPNLSIRKKESFKIFDDIAKTYDFLNHLLSMGIDVYWRNRLLKKIQNKADLVALDLATGTGDLAITLSKHNHVKKVLGMDLSKGMVSIGETKVKDKGLDNIINFQIGDACNIPLEDNSFDVVTISFGIRNFPDPKKSLREILRVLKPGGRLLILEFGMPKNFLVSAVYTFYFRYLLPFVGNLVSGHGDAYTYLNKTVEDFAYGQDFADWMKEAGFNNVKFEELTFGISNLYRGDKL